MIKKNKNQDNLVVSEFFVEAESLEKRYKELKKTMRNLKRFNEVQVTGKVAEA